MKRIITLLIAICLYNINAFGQKKYEMVVEKTDGTETAFNVEDVRKTYFRERVEVNNGDGEEVSPYTSCPDGNHPHYIDLGLPSGTMWACCNVGASAPEDYGSYLTFDKAQEYNPPSLEQIKELVDNCTSTETTRNGFNGRKFTGSNGGSVFFPAVGYRWHGTFYYVGSYGYYWSSAPNGGGNGYYFEVGSSGVHWGDDTRSIGQSVRPVR